MTIKGWFAVFTVLLSAYLWPWQLPHLPDNESWLITVATLQLITVMSCNIIVRESWILPVIMIEVLCLSVNISVYLGAEIFYSVHGDMMLCALILELLIITINMPGAIVERVTNSLGFLLRGTGLGDYLPVRIGHYDHRENLQCTKN